MASRSLFRAQSFRKDRRGALVGGEPRKCRDAEEARSLAEQLSGGRGATGAVAIEIQFDDELGPIEEPTTLAAYGIVPSHMKPPAVF